MSSQPLQHVVDAGFFLIDVGIIEGDLYDVGRLVDIIVEFGSGKVFRLDRCCLMTSWVSMWY